MTTHTYPPTPTSTTPAPGEGSGPSPVVSPGALPPFVLGALCALADKLEEQEEDRRIADFPTRHKQRQANMAEAFEEVQSMLTDALADAMVEAFGVPFPESSAKSDAWARRKGLLPIPDEPLSGDGVYILASPTSIAGRLAWLGQQIRDATKLVAMELSDPLGADLPATAARLKGKLHMALDQVNLARLVWREQLAAERELESAVENIDRALGMEAPE